MKTILSAVLAVSFLAGIASTVSAEPRPIEEIVKDPGRYGF